MIDSILRRIQMNIKPPNSRKRNHLNINLTDDDLKKVQIIQKANPELKLDKLFVYSLLKIYGKGNFTSDYNAQYVRSLHQRKERLIDEIEEMKKMLDRKEEELSELNMEINEVMSGNNGDEDE